MNLIALGQNTTILRRFMKQFQTQRFRNIFLGRSVSMSELPPHDFEGLTKKVEKTSSESIGKAFYDQQGMTETEKEISINDKQDSYVVRNRIKNMLIENLHHIRFLAPSVLWFVLWFVLLLSAGILVCYFSCIYSDEKKLREVISNIIYTVLVSLASLFCKSVFSEKK